MVFHCDKVTFISPKSRTEGPLLLAEPQADEPDKIHAGVSLPSMMWTLSTLFSILYERFLCTSGDGVCAMFITDPVSLSSRLTIRCKAS